MLFDEWMEHQMDQAWRYEDMPDILAEMILGAKRGRPYLAIWTKWWLLQWRDG